MKSSILILVAALFAATFPVHSSQAQSLAAAPAVSASEAVFYAHGVIAAKTESANIEIPTSDHIGLRTMASINELIAYLMKRQGFFITSAYFQGRADTFRSLADLFGEP